MYDIFIQQMRDEVTRVGAQELRTPEEVDKVLPNAKGTVLVVVNSVCGCAAGVARPALTHALQNSAKPDKIVTVFAGQDKEATARAREYFTNQPPSSPSFALMRDGQLVQMVHRHQIEGHSVEQVTHTLAEVFNQFCIPEKATA
jgi:putative YphP/YqiW family bacilliredoxin